MRRGPAPGGVLRFCGGSVEHKRGSPKRRGFPPNLRPPLPAQRRSVGRSRSEPLPGRSGVAASPVGSESRTDGRDNVVTARRKGCQAPPTSSAGCSPAAGHRQSSLGRAESARLLVADREDRLEHEGRLSALRARLRGPALHAAAQGAGQASSRVRKRRHLRPVKVQQHRKLHLVLRTRLGLSGRSEPQAQTPPSRTPGNRGRSPATRPR